MVLPPLSKISSSENKEGIVKRNKMKNQNRSAELQDTVNTQGQAAQLRSRSRQHILQSLSSFSLPNPNLGHPTLKGQRWDNGNHQITSTPSSVISPLLLFHSTLQKETRRAPIHQRLLLHSTMNHCRAKHKYPQGQAAKDGVLGKLKGRIQMN